MSTALDFSDFKPTPAQVRSVGASAVIGYVSPEPAKNLTDPQQYLDAGIDVALVWEDSATNALGGSSQGQSDAMRALAQAKALGYPDACTLYFAVDFDVTPAQEPTVQAYIRAAESVVGHARTGVYGGFYPLQSLHGVGLASWYWQTLAWSGGQRFAPACLYQNGQQVFNGGADVNEVLAPFGAWEGNRMIIAIGTDAAPVGGYHIYQLSPGAAPVQLPGGAVEVLVNNDPNPWVVNNAGAIYRWNGNGWDLEQGQGYIPTAGTPAAHSHTVSLSGSTGEGG